METIVVVPFDLLIVQILRNGVVDIQQGDLVAGNAQADVLAQSAVNIHLAGHWDALGHQAAVNIARNKAEGLGERRPALIGESHILAGAFVFLSPCLLYTSRCV